VRDCLVLSYWFPPCGGAGTQRIAKACKHLPALGWNPVVLAGEARTDDQAPFLDPSLESEVEHVEVVRVPAGPERRLLHPLRSLRFRLGMDEWTDRAIPVARDLARGRDFAAVVTSLSPFSGWRLGRTLQRELGIPWVLDLRDPWALDGWRSWRSPLHMGWDLDQMGQALRLADAVVANTPEAARAFERFGVPRARLCVISNGFDRDDFAALDGPGMREEEDTFTLVHVGTLHSAAAAPGFTRNGLRWRHGQLAPLGRSGHYLLRALAQLRGRRAELARRIAVKLYGVVHPSHRELAAQLGLEDLVHFEGYAPHADALRALVAADAVFVPLHDVPPGQRALVVPAKLYEALASGVRVLAALPAGDAADLVRRVPGGVVVPPCDATALAHALEGVVEEALSGTRPERRAPDVLAPFERARLAGLLSETLDRTVRGESLADLPSPWQEAVCR